ncbi:hypothetical protein A4X13_0g8512 [Tilletia indica]|uniref:Protein kinase domain-containing protein n=2 Tax=Tilletia TaxID=13289 RepID=A0A8T8SEI0_9BASI|nr:hypothetical protein A4X13_0g8512 [Tilletia indica]
MKRQRSASDEGLGPSVDWNVELGPVQQRKVLLDGQRRGWPFEVEMNLLQRVFDEDRRYTQGLLDDLASELRQRSDDFPITDLRGPGYYGPYHAFLIASEIKSRLRRAVPTATATSAAFAAQQVLPLLFIRLIKNDARCSRDAAEDLLHQSRVYGELVFPATLVDFSKTAAVQPSPPHLSEPAAEADPVHPQPDRSNAHLSLSITPHQQTPSTLPPNQPQPRIPPARPAISAITISSTRSTSEEASSVPQPISPPAQQPPLGPPARPSRPSARRLPLADQLPLRPPACPPAQQPPLGPPALPPAQQPPSALPPARQPPLGQSALPPAQQPLLGPSALPLARQPPLGQPELPLGPSALAPAQQPPLGQPALPLGPSALPPVQQPPLGPSALLPAQQPHLGPPACPPAPQPPLGQPPSARQLLLAHQPPLRPPACPPAQQPPLGQPERPPAQQLPPAHHNSPGPPAIHPARQLPPPRQRPTGLLNPNQWKMPVTWRLTGRYPMKAGVPTVGEGGFGLVLHCVDKLTGREVAKKGQLLPRGLVPDKRLLREVEVLVRLQGHSAIIELLDIIYNDGRDGADTYIDIVMPLAMGTLSSLIRDRWGVGVSEDDARGYIKQLLHGVAWMHHRGWVHLDLKPSNVLLRSKGRVQITDFGLSRPRDNVRLGRPCGTIGYRPPEELYNTHISNGAMDIWPIGTIYVELRKGGSLFDNSSEIACFMSMLDLVGNKLRQVFRNPLPGSGVVGSGTTFWVRSPRLELLTPLKLHERDFVLRLMTLEPSDRPTAAAALLDSFWKRPSGP